MLRSSCLICASSVEPFISFGKMPIANGFLTAAQLADEYFYELDVVFCPTCGMVQLGHLVEPEKMFHENYAFFSSTSTRMAKHFEQFADSVAAVLSPRSDPLVVEIGSNDGIMLRHFAERGTRHLGVEPSKNVAEIASSRGVRTISRFFDEDLAREILEQHGPADAVLGANVMCHIANIHSVVAGVKRLLKPEGVLVFEDPYLGDIVELTSYDQIYDEHVFYFSVRSLSALFAMHDLEIVDVQRQPVHGGSMRYVVGHKGARVASARVVRQTAKEAELGLGEARTFVDLRERIERSRGMLRQALDSLRAGGNRVVGYGATSKSTTVINYCGITAEHLEFISDTTPIKQGKRSPGAHIPVRPYAEFQRQYPDYALLFAWNHSQEILAKEGDFMRQGGRFLVYVPEVHLVDSDQA